MDLMILTALQKAAIEAQGRAQMDAVCMSVAANANLYEDVDDQTLVEFLREVKVQ